MSASHLRPGIGEHPPELSGRSGSVARRFKLLPGPRWRELERPRAAKVGPA